MAAGVTDKLWEMSDIVKLVEQAEQEHEDSDYGETGTPKRRKAR